MLKNFERQSTGGIILPGQQSSVTRDSIGNRSSIMPTPDSSEVIGMSS